MKKQIIKWTIIILVVVIAICTVRYLRGQMIFSWQVEKVEFRGSNTCSGKLSDTVELTEDEIREAIQYYNTSAKRRSVQGFQCDSDFAFTIHLKGGITIRIVEAGSPRLTVHPALGKDYWVDNEALAEYADKLIAKYNLLINDEH